MNNKLKRNFFKEWERVWKLSVGQTGKGSHMRTITDKIPHDFITYNKSRRVEVVMARLRIGHTGVKSHLFRLGLTEDNLCEECSTPETLEHFIMNCANFHQPRDIMIRNLLNCGKLLKIKCCK